MFVLKLYRLFISPFLHLLCGPNYGCRFNPTCSLYMENSIQEYGWRQGMAMGLKRLLRCHPFSATRP